MSKVKFDRGELILGGAVSAELQDGELEINNGAGDVVGMGGYLGVHDGPVMGTITAQRAVPKVGFASEQDMTDAVMKTKFVEAIVITGGRRYTVNGVPKSLRMKWAVTAACMENFALHGEIASKKL